MLLFINSCVQENKSTMFFIPTQQLRPGKSLVMDLGLYKKIPDVSIHFPQHPQLNIAYNSKTDTLIISSNEKTNSFAIVSFTANGQEMNLMFRLKEMISHTFTYKSREDDATIVVMGGFNDWSRSQLRMEDKDNDGVLEKTVFLDPLRHEYKFVVNGKELTDPENQIYVSNNIGGWNSILDLSVHKSPSPGKIFKGKEFNDRLTFVYEPPADGAMLKHIVISLDNVILHPDVYELEMGKIIVHKRGLKSGRLRIAAVDERDRVVLENHTEIIGDEALNIKHHSDSWYFSVLYSLMVDRFFDGKVENNIIINDSKLDPLFNFKGGDLRGVMEKLERGYFRDLYVSALWISPIQQQPDSAFTEFVEPHRKVSGYHGYWPVSSRTIDTRFGTSGDFKNIVNNAHEQNINVILDFVSNHTHEDHTYFNNNRNWFGNVDLTDGRKNIRLWSEETRLTTWFDTFLPSFDFSANPDAIKQTTNDAIWWLNTYNLDGFRQDAVKHVPHAFWKELTSKMRVLNGEKIYYQIGETFGSDQLIRSYVNPGELDAQFNFSIYFNARWQFSEKGANFSKLAEVIENNLITFDPIHLMGNITSSHDQVRFMSFADGQMDYSDNGTERSFYNPPENVNRKSSYGKLQNFHALNISLPGIPIIYYGEEIGMIGAGDPDNRRMMRFDDDLNLNEILHKQVISSLNKLRSKHTALSLGDVNILLAEGSILILLKDYFNEEILIVMNQGPENENVKLDPRYTYELNYSTHPQNQLNQNSVSLKPYTSLFLERK